jgi:hypothetical protein
MRLYPSVTILSISYKSHAEYSSNRISCLLHAPKCRNKPHLGPHQPPTSRRSFSKSKLFFFPPPHRHQFNTHTHSQHPHNRSTPPTHQQWPVNVEEPRPVAQLLPQRASPPPQSHRPSATHPPQPHLRPPRRPRQLRLPEALAQDCSARWPAQLRKCNPKVLSQWNWQKDAWRRRIATSAEATCLPHHRANPKYL